MARKQDGMDALTTIRRNQDGVRARGPGRRGLTIVELLTATTVFVLVSVSLGQLVVHATSAFSSLASWAQLTARSQVIMDRVLDELLTGRFVTLDPPIPDNSDWATRPR